MATVPAPMPFPGAPRYWRRDYDRRGQERVGRRGGMAFFDLVAGMRLIIYGYSTRSPYPEDRHAEEQAWETYRMFPAVSFSVAATGGEYGGVPLAEVAEITEEEFELARGRGWTDDDNEMGGTR